MLDIQKALQELSEKNLDQIQRETCTTWGARAAASYQNCLEAEGLKKLALWSIAEEFYHEALEHAALVESEDVLSQLKEALTPYQELAAQEMDRYFGQVSEESEKA